MSIKRKILKFFNLEPRSRYIASDDLTNDGIVYDNKTLKQLEKVYTDKHGNNYYQLKHLASMSHIRAISAETATRYADVCLTRERLEEICEDIIEALNKHDVARAAAKAYEIKTRMEFAAETNTLLTLATIYFYIEGEPIDSYDDYWQEKKMLLWKQDQMAMDFFLQLAWERTSQYKTMSEINISDYLREIAQIVEKQFPTNISPKVYSNPMRR
jgi:hypothetical protein